MKNKSCLVSVFFLCLGMFFTQWPNEVTAQTIQNERGIMNRVQQMNLDEKVGQMAQVSIESLGHMDGDNFVFDEAKLKDAVVNFKIGSILNSPGTPLTPAQWNLVIEKIQKYAAQTKSKIPVLYGLDNNHGVNYVRGATLFPQEIGQAATWNRKLVHEVGVITAYESRAAGVPWTFSPVLDLGTNPQWPRIWEGYGEDPFLTAQLGSQFVKGVQNPLGALDKLAVSIKHYMGYSDPKSGQDRTDAWIPENYLREYHLPAFAAAIHAGARTVMVNSSLINGTPVHINKHILTDILKNELKFTGFIVTDWQDIENVYRRDKITNSIREATMLAINAGIDMSMIPYDYTTFCNDVIALVKDGKIPISRINDAVTRILRVKEELRLFETPLTNSKDYPKFGSTGFAKVSKDMAGESITLLKNANAILPLPKNAKILLAGPNANSMRTLNGGWTYTWQGEKTDEYAKDHLTILESLQKKFGEANVLYRPGVIYTPGGTFEQDSIVSMDNFISSAAEVDYIVLCIGENSYTETPGNLEDLTLSSNQLKLAEALYKTGKPVILILNEGRPRIINSIEPGAAAILDIYLPGNYGGEALAEILSGDVNPSGKLPITYPRYTNKLVSYIHKPSEGDGNPQGGKSDVQYPFGFGLSYTTFAYEDVIINKKSFLPGETAKIQVRVTNTGKRIGKEIIPVFISDVVASLSPDVKRLRAFEKIELKPGESKIVSFAIPVNDLAFVNAQNKKVIEAGDFIIHVGNKTLPFSVTKTREIK